MLAPLLLWIVGVGAMVLGSTPLLAALAQPGTNTSGEVIEYFSGGNVAQPDRLISVEGFKAGDHGWYLESGTTGTFVYRIPGQVGSAIGLNLSVHLPSGVTGTILVSAPGRPSTVLATNASFFGERLVLPSSFDSAPSVDLEIQARNSGIGQVLVIGPMTTYLIQGTTPRAPPVYSYLAVGGLAALVTFAFVRRRRLAPVLAVALGLVVAAATATRIMGLFLPTGPLDPDALGYRIYGARFQWWPLFDNGLFSGNFREREPFFPLVVHAFFQVLGPSDFHLRVVSATLSIAVVILSVVAARRRLLWWPAALVVGLLMALSGPLIQESVRGLRLELEMVVLLLLYLALDRVPAKRPWLDAVMVGMIGAVMVLTRTYYIPIFVAAVTLAFLVRYRPSPRAIGLIALAIVIMAGAETAHRVALYGRDHDAFYDTTGYDRWTANMEHFDYHRPLPHPELFPTFADYQKYGPYFGPKISTFQYLFVIHSPQEFVRDSLAGSRQIFDTMDATTLLVHGFAHFNALPGPVRSLEFALALRIDQAIRWLALLGSLVLLVRAWRKHWHLALIPLIVLTWLAMTAFPFDHALIERYRHTWQTYPLVLIAGAWFVQSAASIVQRRFRIGARLRETYHRGIANLDVVLLPTPMVLALVGWPLSGRLRLTDTAVVALILGVLTYRRPALGVSAMLFVVSMTSGAAGSAAAAASLVGILARLRPSPRTLAPLLALGPLALAVLAAGGKPSSATLEFVANMVLVTSTVVVAVRVPHERQQLLWFVAAIGVVAGIGYVLQPAAPPAVELVPVGAVVAAGLYLQGNRWAVPLGLIDLVMVLLLEPVFAWLGVLAALMILAVGAASFRSTGSFIARGVAAGAGVVILASGASLAATTPPADAAWQTRLEVPGASVRQQITVDRTGDNSLWLYARRASAFADYPVNLDVNRVPITSDLGPYLSTDQLTWVRVALPTEPLRGDRLDVQITATGRPNPIDRYIEIGGVFARAPGLSSARGTESAPIPVNGTFLIVPGDTSMPLAPGGLPEPLVRGLLQPPMGEFMPGERGASAPAREQANVLRIWGQSLRAAVEHPLGLGDASLAPFLTSSDVGLGPGLTARNEFMQAAAEWGVAGLAALLLVLAVSAWFARRSTDRLPMALLILTVITMAGESLLVAGAGAVAAWLVVGLCLAATARGAASPSTLQTSDGEMQPATSRPEAIHAG